MSLLMDALRRAEEQKRRKLGEAVAAADHPEHTELPDPDALVPGLDDEPTVPLSRLGASAEPAPASVGLAVDATLEEPSPGARPPEAPLALEPVDPASDLRFGPDPGPNPLDQSSTFERRLNALSAGFDKTRDPPPQGELGATPDEALQGLGAGTGEVLARATLRPDLASSISRALGAERGSGRPPGSGIDDYFDTSTAFDTSGSFGPEANLEKPLKGAAQVTADTVFEAGRARRRGRGRRLGLIVAYAAIFAFCCAGILVYYLRVVSTEMPDIPLPPMAVEPALELELPPPPEVQRPEMTLREAERIAATSMPPATLPSPPALAEPLEQAEQAEQAEPPELPDSLPIPDAAKVAAVRPALGPATGPAPEPASSPPSQAAPDLAAELAALSARLPAPPPTRVGVSDSPVVFTRKDRSRELNALLETAYQALRSGELAAAEQAYLDALGVVPDLRDAQLGLAAIAVAQGQMRVAYDRYSAVLRRYPADEVALAGLFSLTDGQSPLADATSLKLLVEQTDQPAPLHFALGRQHARRGNWADAQQSFFKAFGAAPDNPDYCYNLAVALDRLGQPRSAIEFYEKAIALSVTRHASFEPSVARARIQRLGTLTETDTMQPDSRSSR